MTLKEQKAQSICAKLIEIVGKQYEEIVSYNNMVATRWLPNSGYTRGKLRTMIEEAFVNVDRLYNLSFQYKLHEYKEVYSNRLRLIYNEIGC